MNVYKELPDLVKTVLIQSNGWIVGKSIKDIEEGITPKDWDVLIENREAFQNTINYLSFYDLEINSFGGIKCTLEEEDYKIDVWCEELGHFLQNCTNSPYIYSLKRQLLLKTC